MLSSREICRAKKISNMHVIRNVPTGFPCGCRGQGSGFRCQNSPVVLVLGHKLFILRSWRGCRGREEGLEGLT